MEDKDGQDPRRLHLPDLIRRTEDDGIDDRSSATRAPFHLDDLSTSEVKKVVRDHETGNELKIAKPNVDLVPAGGPRALWPCTCGGSRIAHRLRSRYTHITDTLDAGGRSATPWS